jgi:type VI secretion system secreted protein VgrG
MTITVQLAEGTPRVECRWLKGEERLGEPSRFELEVGAWEPLVAAAIVGQPAAITLQTRYGERVIRGVVIRLTAIATARTSTVRRYRISIGSRLAVLSLRTRYRVHQHLSVPDIVAKVLREGGYGGGTVSRALTEDYAPRDYVVQYAETDAAFVRRLCEEEGLYFRFPEPAGDADEKIEIADRSSSAPPAVEASLPLVDDSGLTGSGPSLHSLRTQRRRRPGKVTLRDHDHEHPAVALEASRSDGTALEKGVEVYEAPGRFHQGGGGDRRARVRLESLRAGALKTTFQSTALALAPGLSLSIDVGVNYLGAPPCADDHVIVAVKHDWSVTAEQHSLEVEAIPRSVPFRLDSVTPRPRIHGVQSAIVTGADGSEIHPDALGRVFVRFHWDREGPQDHGSSLPIRTLQPNTPGSMILPRVGWEVLVLFEDGDPDRPYIIGRSYNAKMPPPYSLPANKTMTVLATDSSPGAKGRNLMGADTGLHRCRLLNSADSAG